MHVLVVAIGSHGDVLPFLALAVELKRRGHGVTVVAPAPFAGEAAGAGLDFEPIGDDLGFEAAAATPSLWRPVRGARRLFEILGRAVRPTCEAVLRRRKRGRTIIVASTLAFGARIAQEASRTPMISVHLSPLVMQSRAEPPRIPGFAVARYLPPGAQWTLQMGIDGYFIDPIILPGLNAYRAELGLAPVGRLRHWWHSRRRALLMFPEWFAPPQVDWPPQSRQMGFPFAARRLRGAVDERLEAFLASGEPPVAVTFGTGMRGGDALQRGAVAACARIGRRAVVVAGASARPEADIDGRVLTTGYAPFHALLPRCAAVIHHGGVGTVAEALACGAPQVVVPLGFDQFDNAERVRRLGCGVVVGRLALRTGGAARALRAVIDDGAGTAARERAKALCAEGDAIGAACDVIEREFDTAMADRRRRASEALTLPPGEA